MRSKMRERSYKESNKDTVQHLSVFVAKRHVVAVGVLVQKGASKRPAFSGRFQCLVPRKSNCQSANMEKPH